MLVPTEMFERDDTELYVRIPKLECQYNGHHYGECSVEISGGYLLNNSEHPTVQSR